MIHGREVLVGDGRGCGKRGETVQNE